MTDSTAARWLSSASTTGSMITAGNIQATINGFPEISHEFAAGRMIDTGWMTVSSSGSQTLTWTADVALTPDYSTQLDDALTLDIWPAVDSRACTPDATPTDGWTGHWSTFPSYGGSLAPGESSTLCVRTAAASAALAVTGAMVPVLTVSGSLSGTQWGTSATAAATLVSIAASPAYTTAVLEDSPSRYWPMNETSGSTVYDVAGGFDGVATAGVTRDAKGALFGSTAPGAAFSGDEEGVISTQTAELGPEVFTLEAWFSSTDPDGGKIVGFGDNPSGESGKYDRHIYLDKAGRLNFGVYLEGPRTITTPKSYNDGAWHHVVGELSEAGLSFYVDGALIDTRTDTTAAEAAGGYWRIGYDASWNGDGALQGSIDEVAVYPTALSSSRVLWHYAVGSGTPYPSFSSTTEAETVSFDASASAAIEGQIVSYAWDFGDGSAGTEMTTDHLFPTGTAGYTVVLTVRDKDGRSASTQAIVRIGAPDATSSPPLDPDRWYQVRAEGTGMCVRSVAKSGTPLDQTTCAPETSQNFRFVPDGDGHYRVLLRETKALVWDVSGDPKDADTAVRISDSTGGDNQRWLPSASNKDATYRFVDKSSQLCLTVAGSKADGATLHQAACSADDPAQRFALVEVP